MKKWFMSLSQAGKVGLVGAVLFGLLIVGAAVDQPSTTKTKQVTDCTGSQQEIPETVALPFEKTQIEDANLEKGKAVITTVGVNGEKTITKRVTTYKPDNCQETKTEIVKEETTKAPVSEVTSIGTKLPPPTPTPTYTSPSTTSRSCHPSYSPCVPNAGYDLDCPDIGMRVSVIGPDSYRLDADNDGTGCDSY